MGWLLDKTKRRPKTRLGRRRYDYLDGPPANGPSPAVRKYLRLVFASRDDGRFRLPCDVTCPEADEHGSSLPAGAASHHSMKTFSITDAEGSTVESRPHVS